MNLARIVNPKPFFNTLNSLNSLAFTSHFICECFKTLRCVSIAIFFSSTKFNLLIYFSKQFQSTIDYRTNS